MTLKMYSQESKLIPIGILLIVLLGCYKEDEYNYSSQEILENLTLNFEKDSIPADGKSSVKLRYAFPIEADESLTSLHLVTSKGKFLESDDDSILVKFLTLDSSEEKRIKELTLISSTSIGECIISATVLDYIKRDTILFHRAYPIRIKLDSEKFFIKNDTIALISFKVSLNSENGTASSGQLVFFEGPLQHGIQDIEFNPINSLGQTTFQYVFTDTSFVGSLLFEAKAINQLGDTIMTSKNIQVID